jgi:serine/threonine-protein kinase
VDGTSWELAKRVFYDALEKEGAERIRVLEAACGNDAELRARVDSLLRSHDAAGSFLADVTVTPAQGRATQSGPRDTEARFQALQSAIAGRYSLERELGRGGMGVVYLGRDVALDRPVAIKLLSTELGGRLESRERFLREARTAAGLAHPHIVPVHAVEERDDFVFFVMGFVDGETVGERLRRSGPMAVEAVVRMLQEVAWALGHAHGRGVVHRDIKPDNIMLDTATGRALVTDFGIARTEARTALTTPGSLLGTPEYVSPEQAMGEEVDGRSDVYSLGVTSFFALTGRLPFEAKSVQGLITKHLQEPPPPVAVLRPDVPRKLARAIARCLAKDPAARFATAEELADAVSEARAQVVEMPAAIAEVRKEADVMVVEGAGFAALSAMVALEALGTGRASDFLGFAEFVDWGVRVAVWLLTAGLIGGRVLQIVVRSRAAIRQGFAIPHLAGAFADRRRDGRASSRDRERSALTPRLEASAFAAALLLLALAWIFIWNRVSTGGLLSVAVALPLVVLPVLVGRALGARLIRTWPATRAAWARMWTGRVGERIFRVAGLGLQHNRPVPASQPTEVLVAGAAADLFDALPTEYQDRLSDLPDLVRRLQAAADALRSRDEELESALAAVGTAGPTVGRRVPKDTPPAQAEGYSAVEAHRAKVVEDLDAARRVMDKNLAETVAALENLRLGLLRLKAGVGTPDELTADLSAAREIGFVVKSLLEGERQVVSLLHDEHASAAVPMRNHSRMEDA